MDEGAVQRELRGLVGAGLVEEQGAPTEPGRHSLGGSYDKP